MTPDRPPHDHPRADPPLGAELGARVDATTATVPESLLTLDPTTALAADVDALPTDPNARLHTDAALWLALAESHAAWQDPATADHYLAAADALAIRHGYHQLSFQVEAARDALRRRTLGEPRRPWPATPPLDRHATAVLDALAHLPTSAAELLVM